MPELDLNSAEDRVLTTILRRQAGAAPDEPFVLTGAGRYSFGEIDRAAEEHAAGLARLGVGRGDPVAILMGSSVELVVATFAANKLGAVWVPTNTDYKGEWLRTGLVDSRANVLLVDGELTPRLAELGVPLPFEHVVVRGEPQAELEGVTVHPFEALRVGGRAVPEVAWHYGDTSAVLWTSGTTGRAKGVMQSHNAWIRAAETGAVSSDTRPGDVLYCCLPLYNSAAWVGVIYRALLCGLPFGLDPQFSVESFWDRVRAYGATQLFTLGAMHFFLLGAPARPDDRVNPARVINAIPLPDQMLQPFMERFGIERVVQGYGQSEIMGLVSRYDDATTSWNPNAAGVPMPGVEVQLLDDDDQPVPDGEAGEFCVRPTSPFVLFNGYFNNPESTLRAFRNLWYHTGDLGRRDADGQYHFVDRKADYIRFKGRNVSSFAVEAAVNGHPAVAESAAFGIASEVLESEAEIMVEVVLQPGAELEPEALARFVNDNAPYFFVPRYVRFSDALPHTPTGRVQKYKLRQRGVTADTWDRAAAGFELRR